MTKKNFEIDLKNILPPEKIHRSRRKQKQAIVGAYFKFFSICLMITLLLLNVALIVGFNLILNERFQHLQMMKIEGKSIISVYTDICRQTNEIDHTKIIDREILIEIRKQLGQVGLYMNKLKFKESTNQKIRAYFLQNSCQILLQNNYVDSNFVC